MGLLVSKDGKPTAKAAGAQDPQDQPYDGAS